MRPRTVQSVGALLAEMATQIEAATRPSATPRQAAPSVATEQDLKDYLWQTFGISYPSTRVCATHVSPWEVVRDAYFAVHPVIVLKGSRGFAGKTTILGGLVMAESCLLGADVMLLGGSARQSRRVHQAMSGWWSAPNAPRYLLKDEPGAMFTRFARGNEVEAVPASQRSVRGGHAQRLRVDEADEMDLALLDAAMGGAMGLRAGVPRQTLIASTHQYPDKTFSEVLRRASEKGWPVMEVCYRETVEPHGWLPVAEVQGKRAEMTEAMWRTEVELQEPSSEGRALDPDAVERMFQRDLGESDGRAGSIEEFEAPASVATYATGADWGKAHDYTAIATLRTDCQPMRFVAFYRDRKKPLHLIVPEFDRRLAFYGGVGCHDAHGIGAVVDEMLERKHLTEAYTQWQGAARMALFSEYISAIERGQIQAPLSEPWYRAHRYVTNDDLYGNGHPPDEFVGCALAYRAARGASRHVPLELLFQGGADSEEIRAQLEAAKARLGLRP